MWVALLLMVQYNYILSIDIMSATLCTGATAISHFTLVIGFLAGFLVMHLRSRKKAVYSLAAKEQANVRPVYEEVSPKEEIELNNNQAYRPL